jgi:hypothetical protein
MKMEGGSFGSLLLAAMAGTLVETGADNFPISSPSPPPSERGRLGLHHRTMGSGRAPGGWRPGHPGLDRRDRNRRRDGDVLLQQVEVV